MGEKIIVDLTEGIAAGLENCPACDASPEFVECVDGDTVFVTHYDVDALDLHCLRGQFAFHAMLLAFDCESCGQTFNNVQVDLIPNPDITEAWANKYFWQNEIIEEPEKAYSVTLKKPDRPPLSWTFTRTETAAGLLDRHFLPLAGHYAGGQNGLQSCSGDTIWMDAAFLVNRFWYDLTMINACALPGCYEYDPEFADDDIPF